MLLMQLFPNCTQKHCDYLIIILIVIISDPVIASCQVSIFQWECPSFGLVSLSLSPSIGQKSPSFGLFMKMVLAIFMVKLEDVQTYF